MRQALREVWPQIDGNFLLKLCDSVPRRQEACLKNKGGGQPSTKQLHFKPIWANWC